MIHSNELYHHGILGQKWGVRRFQNEDGTLTEKGRKRLLREERKKADNQKIEDVKNRGTLSSAEIKEKIERIKLEKELRTLTEAEIYPGKTAAKRVLNSIGEKTLTVIGTGALLYGVKAAVSGKFDFSEFGNSLFNGGPKKK